MTWSRKRGARVPEAQRFFSKIENEGDVLDCWQWIGALVSKGYGSFRRSDGSIASAHRWIWEYMYGPIPVGLEVDHRCFNRACVNPGHLELVTHAENVRRGRTNQNDGKTHCLRGHPFDEENTHVLASGKRQCRTCGRENMRRYRSKKAS